MKRLEVQREGSYLKFFPPCLRFFFPPNAGYLVGPQGSGEMEALLANHLQELQRRPLQTDPALFITPVQHLQEAHPGSC